jgi:outer membrane receptor protein involved in Fe transport
MPDRGKSFAEVPRLYGKKKDELNPYAISVPTVTDYVSNTMSYYATASYMYDDRYAINFSVRADASNTFGSEQKFNPIWAAGLRWNATDEAWLEGNEYINHLSMTATFGYQGNVAENVSNGFIAKMLPPNTSTGETMMTWTSLPNKDLKWEKTRSIDLGVNFALFNNRVNGHFDWYWKKTNDVIVSAEIPAAAGRTRVFANDGTVENSGWEFAFSLVPVRTKEFTWTLGFSFSNNNNSVESDIEKEKNWRNAVNGTMNKKGYPVSSFWAFDLAGLNSENELRNLTFTTQVEHLLR